MARIGYIGLGLMGSAMARNLMKAGNTLDVHNRSHHIVEQLVSEGAHDSAGWSHWHRNPLLPNACPCVDTSAAPVAAT